MKNFKEIAEKCLSGELSGTFVTAFGNNWHSNYLQRHTILGHEMPVQYVLGPGVIYNDMGQCTSNEKVKIVDFIPDTMKNFKEIVEKCAAGELYGTIILNDGREFYSKYLSQYIFNGQIVEDFYTIGLSQYLFHVDQVINFIPNNMQKKVEIDIPEGKVPVMEQTEKGVVITWKEKEITYADVISKLVLNQNAIYEFWSDKIHKGESSTFYKKVEVLRKLTNIRNYFGKPKHFCDGVVIKCVNSYCGVETGQFYFDKPDLDSLHEVVFAKREHAEQAIKMLGDELKYLFEPW